jgi:adenylate cyclase
VATEIERKFLVDAALWRATTTGTLYRQGYPSSVKERVVRVRIAGDRGFLTIKGLTIGLSRLEFEYSIPLPDAIVMLDQLCERPLIEKTRYREAFADRIWEIDVFTGITTGWSSPKSNFRIPMRKSSSRVGPVPMFRMTRATLTTILRHTRTGIGGRITLEALSPRGPW